MTKLMVIVGVSFVVCGLGIIVQSWPAAAQAQPVVEGTYNEFDVWVESRSGTETKQTGKTGLSAFGVEKPILAYVGYEADRYEDGEEEKSPNDRQIFPGGRVQYGVGYVAGKAGARDLKLLAKYPEYTTPINLPTEAKVYAAERLVEWRTGTLAPGEEVAYSLTLKLNPLIPIKHQEIKLVVAANSKEIFQKTVEDTQPLWQAVPIRLTYDGDSADPVPGVRIRLCDASPECVWGKHAGFASLADYDGVTFNKTAAGKARLILNRRDDLFQVHGDPTGWYFRPLVIFDSTNNPNESPQLEMIVIRHADSSDLPIRYLSKPRQLSDERLRKIIDFPDQPEADEQWTIARPDPSAQSDWEETAFNAELDPIRDEYWYGLAKVFGTVNHAATIVQYHFPGTKTKPVTIQYIVDPKNDQENWAWASMGTGLINLHKESIQAQSNTSADGKDLTELHEFGHIVHGWLKEGSLDQQRPPQDFIDKILGSNSGSMLTKLHQIYDQGGRLYVNHLGFVNDYSDDAFIEGFATYFEAALANILFRDKQPGAIARFDRGTWEYTPFTDRIYTPFEALRIQYPKGESSQKAFQASRPIILAGWSPEEKAITELMWSLTAGNAMLGYPTEWDTQSRFIQPPRLGWHEILELVQQIGAKQNVGTFSEALQGRYPGTYDLYLSHLGLFRDTATEENGLGRQWVYDAGKDELGSFGNGPAIQMKTQLEFKPRVGYNDLQDLNIPSRAAFRYDNQMERNAALQIKFAGGTSESTHNVTLSVVYQEPYQHLNYSFAASLKSGEKLNLNPPGALFPTKIVVTADNAAESFDIYTAELKENQDQLALSDIETDHIAAVSFNIVEGATPPAVGPFEAEHPDQPPGEEPQPPVGPPVPYVSTDEPISTAPDADTKPPTGTVTPVDGEGNTISLLDQLRHAPTQADAKRLLREIITQADKDYAAVLTQTKVDRKATVASAARNPDMIKAVRDTYRTRTTTAYQTKSRVIFEARQAYTRRLLELR